MDDSNSRRRKWLICGALVLAVFAAYGPLWHCGFVLFDDNEYVTDNDVVKQGIIWPGIVWAFTTFHASNWHPLTWLSHMLDCQFYGMNPAGHHFTSLLLHSANAVLLFLLLTRMTGEVWPAALVAALFALHPLRVESVAWISERKDVLSALFWLLSLRAYVDYARDRRKAHYGASLAWFALGLMAKPMLVTLPLVLILLDYWPLRRLRAPFGPLLVEKIPYAALAAASCVVTVLAQRQGGAMASLGVEPLGLRLENVPVAYVRYLLKTFVPANLAVYYPFPDRLPGLEVAGATTVLLVLITAFVLWRRREQPWLAVGWLWFLGMLVPVIGVVHVGAQAMADRYTYLPCIGLFIAVVWSARAWLPAISGWLAVAGCVAMTWTQVHYWRDSEALFRRALAVTPANSVMENDLGKVLLKSGRAEEALPHLRRAVESGPGFPLAHYNLGQALLAAGQVADALGQFEIQVSLQPNDATARFNFGAVLLDNGLAQDALPQLEKAVELRPDSFAYRAKLADALRQTGHAAEAISQYEESRRLRLDYAPSAAGLAWMLATTPDARLRDGHRAVELAMIAGQLAGRGDPRVMGILAAAYAESGNVANAAVTAQRALELASMTHQTTLSNALREQLEVYRGGKPFRDAK